MEKNILEDYFEHTSADFPVEVYYVDLSGMFMKHVRHHWHKEMEIDLVREGRALVSAGGREFELSEGFGIWINQDRIHSIRPAADEKTMVLSIQFDPSYLFEKDSFLTAKYFAPLAGTEGTSALKLDPSDGYGKQALVYVEEILSANLSKDYGYELRTKAMLCSFWLELLKRRSDDPADARYLSDEGRVKEASAYIREHFADAITLDDIAASIHVSRSECCRCFKRVTSAPPFEHLMIQRIFESARRMQRSDPAQLSIAGLASACGFNNASYYNRIFRKYMGMTPAEYRKIIRKSHRDALNPHGISLARL